ncbi:DUF6876 family protein [Fortiea contorta]|uniref:DUF6876 family protein n=1 Tax=Fortiea contorta TaxID=1892405 RepID=UPI000347CF4A|nr:DUF6876 family protein [Fortiea contorta]
MINQDDLAHFTGSSTNFKHWSKKLLYTEGIQFVAEEAQAYWLIDAIASYQTNELLSKHPELKEFQLWQLEVNTDKTAVLTCGVDSDCHPDVVQNIEFTDFPLQQIKLYVCQTVLMLPSEY